MYKKMAVTALMTLSLQLQAQAISDDPARPSVGQTGQLFTIKWTPKSRKIEIGVAGKEAASLDPEKIILLGKVYPAKGEPRALHVEPAGEHFQVMEKVEPNSSLEIEVKEKGSTKSEKFKIPAKP